MIETNSFPRYLLRNCSSKDRILGHYQGILITVDDYSLMIPLSAERYILSKALPEIVGRRVDEVGHQIRSKTRPFVIRIHLDKMEFRISLFYLEYVPLTINIR